LRVFSREKKDLGQDLRHDSTDKFDFDHVVNAPPKIEVLQQNSGKEIFRQKEGHL
jgi:hypothetical protein